MIYVVATSRDKFALYCMENKLPLNQARWVKNADDLFGMRGAVDFTLGCEKGPEFYAILTALRKKYWANELVLTPKVMRILLQPDE